jgi:cellulose synthase/poly-beta-1,6-N-acetylglucosamine synthase-like glycosyltransferase
MIYLFFAFLAVFFVIYMTGFAFCSGGFEQNDGEKFVSVIVPARNEENNLPFLIESLKRQTYRNFELILVLDRCTDNSGALARKHLSDAFFKFTIIEKNEFTGGTGNPKAEALIAGLAQAEGEIFSFTDADCSMKENWLEVMLNGFEPGISAVIGPVKGRNVKGLLKAYQYFEHNYRFSYAAASTFYNLVNGGFGNNMAVTRKAYLRCGGFEAVVKSYTEDAELLNNIKKKGDIVSAVKDSRASVYTELKSGFGDFFSQAGRWAAGAYYSTSLSSRFSWLYLHIQILAVIFCLFMSPASFSAFLWFAGAYSFVLLTSFFAGLGLKVSAAYYCLLPLNSLLFLFVSAYGFIACFFGFRVEWKGTLMRMDKYSEEIL